MRMMRTLVVCVCAPIALLAFIAAKEVRAEDAPSLPAGWIAGSKGLEDMPAGKRREFGSFQSNHEFTFRPRLLFPGFQVDLAQLPVVEIEKSSVPTAPPRELPQGSPAEVVVLKKGAAPRVSVQGYETGFMQVGRSLPTAVGRQSQGGVVDVCGPKAKELGTIPLSYEVLRRVDEKGSLELVWARGFIDAASCRVAIVERHVGRPQHVAGGIVYAFRTHCASCEEGARDVLHVLTPQASDNLDKVVPFDHRALVLAPGKSAAFEGVTSFKNPLGGGSWGMPDWQGIIDRKCKDDTIWCAKRVRLEVSQARGEPQPVVFVGGHLD